MSPAAVGLIGDIITFIGAVILALDALQSRRDYEKREQIRENLLDPDTRAAQVGVAIEGRVVMTLKDMELIAKDKTFRRAVLGFSILCAGLFFLICSRLMEIYKT